ncbi:MAG: hypothetical protein ACKOOH_07600 [Cyanobium sp.]
MEALRTWLARHPQVKQDLPQRVSWSGVRDGALLLRLECGLGDDLEAFHGVRHELLLEVSEQLARRRGRLVAER